MVLQMAIAITLRGFNDLGYLVTPIFLLTDCFPYRFSTFSEKCGENLLTRSLIFFAKCIVKFSFIINSSFIYAMDFKCLLSG